MRQRKIAEDDFYIANKGYGVGWDGGPITGKIHIAEGYHTLCGRQVGGENQGWTTSKSLGDIEEMIKQEEKGLNYSDWAMCSRCVVSYKKRTGK